MEWKQWKNQGELKKSIRYWIDTGAGRSHICDGVESDFKDKYERKEIHRAISELKKDMLIVHCGYGNYKVRAWSHDSLTIGTGQQDVKKALRVLADNGVFHEYMVRDNLVDISDVPDENKEMITKRYGRSNV